MLNRARLFLVGVALLLLSACASAPKEHPLRYVLPVPPDAPIVEWLNTYHSDDDFPKTEAEKRMEMIVGKPPLTELIGPSGIAADGEGRIFVGDLYLRNIMVYDLKARKVRPITGEGGGGANIEPRQMTMDSKKQLYIADSGAATVRVLSREGKSLRTYGSSKELVKPLGVAVDEARGRVYVSDGPKHRVQVFDLQSGQHLSTIGTGEAGSKEGELYNPIGLALNKEGDLYVVELLNARVSVFSPDGKFKKFFGERTDSLRGFENPRGAAFDSEGNLWLADFRRGGLRAYDTDGTLLFAMEGNKDSRLGFATPASIFIDGNDEIYIADFMERRFSHWRFFSKANKARYPVTEADLARIRQEVAPAQPVKK